MAFSSFDQFGLGNPWHSPLKVPKLPPYHVPPFQYKTPPLNIPSAQHKPPVPQISQTHTPPSGLYSPPPSNPFIQVLQVFNPGTAISWYTQRAALNRQIGSHGWAHFQDAAAGYVSSWLGGAQTASQKWWGTGFGAAMTIMTLGQSSLFKTSVSVAAGSAKMFTIIQNTISSGEFQSLALLDLGLTALSTTLSISGVSIPKTDILTSNHGRWALGEVINIASKGVSMAKLQLSASDAFLMGHKESLSQNIQPNVGGILLDRCATTIGNHPSISGAYWDSERGILVLYSQPESEKPSYIQLSGLEFDHLLVSLRAALAGEHLGVSIDPSADYRDGIHKGVFPPDRTPMYVSYLGNTEGTLFGAIMFEADRVMKCLSKETDNTTGKSLRAEMVEGYKSLFQLFNQYGSGGSGSWFRFWFVIDTVQIAHDSSAKSFRFGNVKIKVLNETELAGGSKTKQDPASAAFARHLTEYYDEYAIEFPIFARLKEIAKISALARFLVNQGVSLDHKTIFRNQPLPVPTPKTTPGIIASSHSGDGRIQMIFGGVDMDVDPVIISKNDKDALINSQLAENAYPGSLFSSWGFNTQTGLAIASAIKLKATNKPYRALSSSDHAFTGSWKNSIRSIRRYYDSSIPGGDFGPGWWLFLPYRIQVIPKAMKTAEVLLQSEIKEENNPSVILLHDFIKSDTVMYRRYPAADQKQGMAYCRLTHQKLIQKGISYSVNQSDVVFLHNDHFTFTDENFSFRFNNKGQVIAIKKEEGVVSNYNWQNGHISDIDFGSGKKYKVKYDYATLYPRISEIVASDGEVLKYAYKDGLLSECFVGKAKKVSYRYDNLNRITETRNGVGAVIKRNAYNEHGDLIENQESKSAISDGTLLKRYFKNGHTTKVSDESGGYANYKYRKDGNLHSVRITTNEGGFVEFNYNEDGKLRLFKDIFGTSHHCVYYPDGNINKIEKSDGSWLNLPSPDKFEDEITGSDAITGDYTIKRNKIGLPVLIVEANGNKHKFRYNKRGLRSIKAPGSYFKVHQNNGISEFEVKDSAGFIQKTLIDNDKSVSKISLRARRRNIHEISINESDDKRVKISDCAGTTEYKFNEKDLEINMEVCF